MTVIINSLLVLLACIVGASPVLTQYVTGTGSPLTTVSTTSAPDCGCVFSRATFSLVCDKNGRGYNNPCYAACEGIPTSEQVQCPYNTRACNCTVGFVTEPGSDSQFFLNPAECSTTFVLGHDVTSCYGYCCVRNLLLVSPDSCRRGLF